MLGYETPFGYLKAIELCSDPNIVNKKAGYITAALCIPPEHEFRFMIVNRLQMVFFLLGSDIIFRICKAKTTWRWPPR